MARLCRVRNRVRQGGHNVPPDDIRRRYLPSLRNFFELYLPMADVTMLYEATAQPPRRVARWIGESVERFQPDLYEEIRRQADFGAKINADEFMKASDEAMRRAYLVAKKDAGRYGLS